MMNGTEIKELADALDTAYLRAADLDEMLLSIPKRPLAGQAALNATLPEAILTVVRNSVAEGWGGSLLRAVSLGRPDSQPLKAFFALHRHLDPNLNPLFSNPWQSTLLVGQLFMGRDQIRRDLWRMDTSPFAKKVMVIASETRQVGKTHTCSLIKFVRQEPSHKVTYLDLDERRCEDLKKADHNLRAVAFELAEQWGIDTAALPKQDDEQEPRWAQLLAPYLVGRANMNGGVVRWLVIDGFRKRNQPSAGVKELIDRLSELLMVKPNFRFLLLNYREPLPLPVRYFEEWVQPLTGVEIVETLDAAYTYYARRPATLNEKRLSPLLR